MNGSVPDDVVVDVVPELAVGEPVAGAVFEVGVGAVGAVVGVVGAGAVVDVVLEVGGQVLVP